LAGFVPGCTRGCYVDVRMRRHLGVLSKRLRFRHVVPIVVVLGIFGGVISCVLADPPPALPTILPEAPLINANAALPPNYQFITDWPESGSIPFSVPVLVNNPTKLYVLLDYGTPSSSYPSSQPQTAPTDGGPPSNLAVPVPDGGGVQVIDFTLLPPTPPEVCHTITFFADLADDPMILLNKGGPGFPATLSYTPALCSTISWVYDPTGVGDCMKFDAGGIPDAETHDSNGADATDALNERILH